MDKSKRIFLKSKRSFRRLRWDIIASRCLRTRSNRSLYRVVGS